MTSNDTPTGGEAKPCRLRDTTGDSHEPDRLNLVEFRQDQAAHVLAARIPVRFTNARVDNPQVARWVARFVDEPTAAPPLLLSGPTGTGKTWLCWAAVRAAVEGLAQQGKGLDWRATTHPDLNAMLRPKPDGSHNYALKDHMAAPLLMLDDLGAGKSTDWTEDTLYRLVDHRWSHCLPTIYSTNLAPRNLSGALGERVVSRLGDAVRVAITGEDRRWKAA
jgi:DNA replication protein DnaC